MLDSCPFTTTGPIWVSQIQRQGDYRKGSQYHLRSSCFTDKETTSFLNDSPPLNPKGSHTGGGNLQPLEQHNEFGTTIDYHEIIDNVFSLGFLLHCKILSNNHISCDELIYIYASVCCCLSVEK